MEIFSNEHSPFNPIRTEIMLCPHCHQHIRYLIPDSFPAVEDEVKYWRERCEKMQQIYEQRLLGLEKLAGFR